MNGCSLCSCEEAPSAAALMERLDETIAKYQAVPGGLIGTYLGNSLKKARSSTELTVAFGVLLIIVGARLVLTPLFEKRKAAPPEAQADSTLVAGTPRKAE